MGIPEILAIIGLVIGAASAGTSYHQAESQRQAVETEKGKAAGRNQQAKDELDAQKLKEATDDANTRNRDAQALRLRQGAFAKRGREGTILGGAYSAGGTKTLLGS